MTDVQALQPTNSWFRFGGRAAHGAAAIAEPLTTRWCAARCRSLPPLFILGPPRCGSTLLYQWIIHCYDVGYFANVHHRYFRAPTTIELVTRATRRARDERFESVHGYTAGWNAPSENWNFWYRFFRRTPQYVPATSVNAENLAALGRAVRAFATACGRPLVIKNLPCSLRLAPIQMALPEAVFLVVGRDLCDNAASILAARWKEHGNYDAWWSVEPPDFERLQRLPAHQQAVEQIRSIRRVIQEDGMQVHPDRYLAIDYEAFCDDTETTFGTVDAFLQAHGVALRRRADSCPAQFARRSGSAVPPQLRESLEDYCASVTP